MKIFREYKLIEAKLSIRIISFAGKKIQTEAGNIIREKKVAISQINILKMKNTIVEEILSKLTKKRMINIITLKTKKIVRDISKIMIIILRRSIIDRINNYEMNRESDRKARMVKKR